MPIGPNLMRTQEYALTPEFFDDWTETHRRWSCYHHYGVQCCVDGCHRKGTHVVHWYSRADFVKYGDTGKGEHIDLVGFEPDGTTEFLMTVDHIVPDSKGGPKVWWNLQPMCEFHNGHQQAQMIYIPNRQRLIHLGDMVNVKFSPDLSDREMLDALVLYFQAKQEKSNPKLRKIKDKY